MSLTNYVKIFNKKKRKKKIVLEIHLIVTLYPREGGDEVAPPNSPHIGGSRGGKPSHIGEGKSGFILCPGPHRGGERGITSVQGHGRTCN